MCEPEAMELDRERDLFHVQKLKRMVNTQRSTESEISILCFAVGGGSKGWVASSANLNKYIKLVGFFTGGGMYKLLVSVPPPHLLRILDPPGGP